MPYCGAVSPAAKRPIRARALACCPVNNLTSDGSWLVITMRVSRGESQVLGRPEFSARRKMTAFRFAGTLASVRPGCERGLLTTPQWSGSRRAVAV